MYNNEVTIKRIILSFTNFDYIKTSENWKFGNLRSTEQWTHGYHRYPAKFLPNIVKQLIEKEAIKNSPIADPFAGCGTTLVEAKVHGFESYGVDINPTAELITKAKTTPIEPQKLIKAYSSLVYKFNNYEESNFYDLRKHKRIDYWFFPKEKYQIAFLYKTICEVENENISNFFLVSLSHILKNCSRWLQSGTKPQIDPYKNPSDPFYMFKKHTQIMMNKNKEFFDRLQDSKKLDILCDIRLGDARNTSWQDGSIGTIITSPPYVTSYEYADIHQLTGYWYEYFSDLTEFRRHFIGTSYSKNENLAVSSKLGQKIVNDLNQKSFKIAKNVANYFIDMTRVVEEMYRVLQPNGKICVVIGNTTVKDVHIRSAEVFWELLKKAGFRTNKRNIIKRDIPNKLMPTIRNKNNGRFTKVVDPDSKRVYSNEYILIARK